MLAGQAIGLQERSESNELLLEDPVSEHDEEAEVTGMIIYSASFDELARSHVQYDTIIWLLISLLLVLAWGIGIVMLLYIPVRRYVLSKDISSRKLYVTQNEIIYKVSRPWFLPFLGYTKIEKHVPLPLVIDVIIEQGCLQSRYGIHTFRVESIAHGKAAPVDELQVQGVSDPGLLRKVIITEASRSIEEVGRNFKSTFFTGERESTPAPMGSFTETPTTSRLLSSNLKVMASPRRTFPEAGGTISSDVLLHKLQEVEQSVKRIESLIGGSQQPPAIS
ncbi:hypothetical protein AAC387_Pa11g0405 [Persea americana]|eukprot:TRINITY_DN10369_c0_g1_i1.p1 TRINITY_DN10369_c0_g1~~TRINITY_DN10369_c0_g1_i1.p1  ORF type:complete len:278 (+),score=44.40 TRINITY_DN10369_c0_g1_i1:213-1046(+)